MKPPAGQSVLSMIVALGIFALLAASLVSLVLGSFNNLNRARELVVADGLAQEGVEAVRAIRDRAWNELIYNQSTVATSSGRWILLGEGVNEKIDKFNRSIEFFPVYRDGDGEIVAASAPGAYEDVLSRQVKVNLSWENELGGTNNVERRFYLTAWRAKWWSQTDWSGGSGQSVWLAEDKYDSDDGQVDVNTMGEAALAKIATSTYATSSYLISSAFNTGSSSAFAALIWQEEISSECSICQIKFWLKTAPDVGGSPGTWSETWCGPEGEDGDEDDYFATSTGQLIHFSHNTDQWIKYKVELFGDGSDTPILKEVKIYYQN
jgi:type II secretory pathway pseudopilin PulG